MDQQGGLVSAHGAAMGPRTSRSAVIDKASKKKRFVVHWSVKRPLHFCCLDMGSIVWPSTIEKGCIQRTATHRRLWGHGCVSQAARQSQGCVSQHRQRRARRSEVRP